MQIDKTWKTEKVRIQHAYWNHLQKLLAIIFVFRLPGTPALNPPHAYSYICCTVPSQFFSVWRPNGWTKWNEAAPISKMHSLLLNKDCLLSVSCHFKCTKNYFRNSVIRNAFAICLGQSEPAIARSSNWRSSSCNPINPTRISCRILSLSFRNNFS